MTNDCAPNLIVSTSIDTTHSIRQYIEFICTTDYLVQAVLYDRSFNQNICCVITWEVTLKNLFFFSRWFFCKWNRLVAFMSMTLLSVWPISDRNSWCAKDKTRVVQGQALLWGPVGVWWAPQYGERQVCLIKDLSSMWRWTTHTVVMWRSAPVWQSQI